MFEAIFWGGVLRFCQGLTQAAPFLLTGLFVAGVFRRLLGPAGTLRLFGSESCARCLKPGAGHAAARLFVGRHSLDARDAPQRRLRWHNLCLRTGCALFNPLSFLYGLTLSEPSVIFAFGLGSLVVVTVVGALWDWWNPGTAQAEPAPPQVAFGLKRVLLILVVAVREISGPTLGYALIVLAGVVLLEAALPFGSLQTAMNHDKVWAPVTMTLVAVPAYATPMLAMCQLGMMFQHGNSVGAAFVLLTLGTGANLGLLAWIGRNYGYKRGLTWLSLLLGVVLGIAYAIEKPLFPANVQPANHTHAFDVYCCPFSGHNQISVLDKLRDSVQPFEMIGTAALAGLLLLGLGLRVLDRYWSIEAWLERQPRPRASTGLGDLVIPGQVLAGLAILGLIAFSVVGCYVYYPTAQEVFEEMRPLKTEALAAALTRDRAVAEHWLEIWDDWIRRMEVGVHLRRGGLTDYQRMKSRILRDKLELLEHAVQHDEPDEINHLVFAVENSYKRMRSAYSPR